MRAYLELFLFEGAALRRKVSALSGGERARVALALALKTGANVLLLDEPTNDLDIATLGSLAELIESWPGCVLVVSHDRFFLDRVVTSILAFEGDGKVQLYAGNWESYREQKREEREGRQAREAGRVITATSRLERAQSQGLTPFRPPDGAYIPRGPSALREGLAPSGRTAFSRGDGKSRTAVAPGRAAVRRS